MSTEIGRWGEACAAEYLRKKRYTVIAVNYHSRYGEIDIIAKKQKVLAFVEVKLRKSDSYGAACEFVTPAKQEKIKLTAQLYLQENGENNLQPRFDVMEIYAPHGISNDYTLRHIENAFE